jgi:hypothetical protein
MDGALAWISQIAAWVGQFFPRWVILDTTEGAIKYVRGKHIKECHAGIHWYWPVTTTWVVYPTARQGDRLETQTMESSDGVTFLVGGILVSMVDDLTALITTTHSPADTIKDIALTAIHDVCCNMDWAQLKAEQRAGTLDTKLKNAAQKELKTYGVRVVKLMLTNLAKCRVYKMSQSTAQEEN